MASGDLRRWLTLLPDSRQRRTLAVRRDRRNSSRSDPCVICERAIIVVEFGFHDASPGKTEGADVAAPRGSEGNVIVVFSGRRIVRGRRLFALPALDGEVVDGQVHVIVANAVPLVAALSNATFEGHQVADVDFCYAFMLFLEERDAVPDGAILPRSEEHTSELQSLMRISYA